MYHNFDEEEEDIPDEGVTASEMIQVHNRIVPRDSITSNILTHSFLAKTPFSQMSASEDSQQEISAIKRHNNMYSSHASLLSSQINPLDQNSFVRGMHIVDQTAQDRAIYNWEKLFKRCMLEYRRHRLRKAAKNMLSPSPRKHVLPQRQQSYYVIF